MSKSSKSIVDYIEEAVHGHAKEIGIMTWEWNSLQNAYSELFAQLVTPNNHALGYALWNSIKSDKGQRDLLSAAIKILSPEDHGGRKELLWAIHQTNELSSSRNSTIHAPYTFVIESGAIKVVPDSDAGNAFAAKLLKADLVKICKTCALDANMLRAHVKLLGYRLHKGQWDDPTLPWPDRPPMLNSELRNPTPKPRQSGKPVKQKRREKPSRG